MSVGIATLGMYRWQDCRPSPVVDRARGGVGGIRMPPKCTVTVEKIRIDEEETNKYIRVVAIRTKNGNGDYND